VRAFRGIVLHNPAAVQRPLAHRRALRQRAIREEDIHHPNIIGGIACLRSVAANAVQECQCSVHVKKTSHHELASGHAQNCAPRIEAEQVQR
jgi:hypothetical protein